MRCGAIKIIMNIYKLKKEYEKRIKRIRAWNKVKEPKYKKIIRIISIILGVILSLAIIALTILFKSDINKQLLSMAIIIIIEFIYFIIIYSYLKRRPDSEINNEDIVSDFEKEKLKSIRRLFAKENICCDDINKIQIIIDELNNLKHQAIPIQDIRRFILNPLIIFFIPLSVVFFDHYTQSKGIQIQLIILLIVLILIASVLIMCFMFAGPIKWFLYRKYDNFINDLKLLQLFNHK